MRITKKNLIELFPDEGEELWRLFNNDRELMRHPVAIERKRECYHRLSYYDVKLTVLNAVARLHGVEYIAHVKDTIRENFGISYLNTGDSYCSTICYDHGRDRWSLSCWADFVERYPHKYC